ncbi:unnamed protein product [Peniophora sp. CBMAI 1063]|nr:unnamed protein product [Peniophora sp. CBMAI 1063]
MFDDDAPNAVEVDTGSYTDLSTISRLPEDVMREIFYAVASLEPTPGTLLFDGVACESARTSGLQWMRLTHVCRSWRTIILRMADLWGRVAFTLPYDTALPTLLDRARDADLDIVSKLHQQDMEMIQHEADHLPSARSLLIASRPDRRLLEYLTQNAMPRLRYLGLRVDLNDKLTVGAPLLSERMVEDIVVDAPRLATLSLDLWRFRVHPEPPIAMPGPSLRFTTDCLRALMVRVSDYTISHVHTLEWIVALLRTSPRLESFALSLSGQRAELDWDAVLKEPAQLSQLRRFTLEDSSGSYGPDIIARLCPSPPAFFCASFGTFRGISPMADIGPEHLLERASNFARRYGGYLCRDNHRALRVQMPNNPRLLTVESFPTMHDPVTFAPRQKLTRGVDPLSTFAELTDSTVLHVATGFTELPNRHEWFGELADHIQEKGKVEQMYLQLDPTGSGGRVDICRERLLRPMTRLHTLYLMSERPFDAYEYGDAYWKDISQLLCDVAPDNPVLSALHTLLVSVEMHRVDDADQHPGELLDMWFSSLANLLARRRAGGGPIQMLRVVGSWESEELRRSMALKTEGHLAQVAKFVKEVTDERTVLS